jgi:transposase
MMTPREAELTRQLEAAVSALEATRRENQLLRQKIDALVRRVFGSSSEQLPANQLELLLVPAELQTQRPEPVGSPAPPAKNTPARRARRERIPDHLPVVEEVLEPELVRADPTQWRRIGEEVSEQLDFEPGRFFRRRLVRPRYVRKMDQDSAPVIAALPPRLQDRGLPAAGLLAHVLVSKYCDHLPLYRQELIFRRRHGVELPRQTLARWVELAADWLKPIYAQIRTGVMSGGYVQIDETPIEYLDPGRGRTGQGYLWTCAKPGGDVLFHWDTSRGADCLGKVLPVDFTGTLQCDGYSAYVTYARHHPHPVTLAACWAHARRKFHDARNEEPRITGWFLHQIQLLYQVEARLREQSAGPNLRVAVRAAHSRMIVGRIRRALERLRSERLPQSLLGQAIAYTLGQWTGLEIFLTDGRVEIDNNTVENAIRPTAIGKKNWLFVGDAGAGERSAVIYTIIESCRRRGIDPLAYLRNVLDRLPSITNHQISTLTPEAWHSALLQRAA